MIAALATLAPRRRWVVVKAHHGWLRLCERGGLPATLRREVGGASQERHHERDEAGNLDRATNEPRRTRSAAPLHCSVALALLHQLVCVICH